MFEYRRSNNKLTSLETQKSVQIDIDPSASKKAKSKTRTPSYFCPYPVRCSVQDYGSFGQFPKIRKKEANWELKQLYFV